MSAQTPYQGKANPTSLGAAMRGTEKAQVAAMSAAAIQILIWALSEVGINVPPAINAAASTLLTGFIVWRVPNRERAS